MAKEPQTITLQDIPGAVSFLKFHGINDITFRKQENGRVIAVVPANPEVYRLLAEFQTNPMVPLTDFLTYQRKVRGMMLDVRNSEMRSIAK